MRQTWKTAETCVTRLLSTQVLALRFSSVSNMHNPGSKPEAPGCLEAHTWRVFVQHL